jgi:hypothetical protein
LSLELRLVAGVLEPRVASTDAEATRVGPGLDGADGIDEARRPSAEVARADARHKLGTDGA